MEPYYDGTEVAVCFTPADTFWSAFYFIACITIFFVLPLFVLILLYAAIACKLLRRHIDFHRPTTTAAHVPSTTCVSTVVLQQQSLRKLSLQLATHKDSNAITTTMNAGGQHLSGGCMRKHRKQVIFMLIAVVSSFFICLLPFRAFTLWVIVAPTEDIATLGIDGYYATLYFSRIMLYLNSALNPILYNLMSSKFRTGFWHLILSCCGSNSSSGSRSSRADRILDRVNRRKPASATATATAITTVTANTNTNCQRGEVTRSDTYEQRRLKFKRKSTFMLSSSLSTSSGTERSSSLSTSSSTVVPAITKRSVLGNAIISITKSTVTTACPLESDEIAKE